MNHKKILTTLTLSTLGLISSTKNALAINLGEIEGVGPFQKTYYGESAKTNLSKLVSNIITLFTILAGLAFIIYFMIGAFKWITSGGDQNKTEEAKRQLTQAAIGIIVVMVSYFVISIIGSVLGFDILNPTKTLDTILK